MSTPDRAPRVIVEDAPAPRLDFGWEGAVVPVALPPPPRSGVGDAALGLAVLAAGFGALGAANLVTDAFSRGPAQGWFALAVAAAGFGLLGAGLWRELRGLLAVGSVDRARAAFARDDAAAARAACLDWAAGVPEAAAVLPALRGAVGTAELRALLTAPLATLRARADQLGRIAAMQAFAATAVSPSAALDVLIVAWRGVRLVRQVATLHGLRPGLAGTVALLRRTLLDAAAVAATDIAVDAAARALLSNRLVEGVAGEAAAGAVAARRMLRLARAAAEACRPLPPDA